MGKGNNYLTTIKCLDCQNQNCENLSAENPKCCSCSSLGQVLEVDHFCNACKETFLSGLQGETTKKFPKIISIKLEAIDEPIEISVNEDDKIGDVIERLKDIAKERGVNLDEWAKEKLGTDKFSFLMMRK